MTTRKKTTGKKTREPRGEQVSFSVEPGTKMRITVEVGEKNAKGKLPVTIHVEEGAGETSQPEQTPIVTAGRLMPRTDGSSRFAAHRVEASGFEALKSRLKAHDLATWLFISAVAVYLITRLIGLTQFPIYFFTDEAIQSQSMIDLIKSGYRDSTGVLFPTYFRNGEYANLGLSVYLQWLPYLLFGKSAVITRAASVLVTLIAAVSIGLVLRDGFKIKHWWTGTLFLSITPAWFLHSRTAFETAEFTAFYAGALCAYLLYRYKSPRYLVPAIFLGALAFYTYGPAQVIVPLTAMGLLISDWRYHWENRRTVLGGFVFAIILALPYLRFRLNDPNAPFAHLHVMGSYLTEKSPLTEKILHYFSEYGTGLSPWYWYIPNDRDLPRHLMKEYGHIMIATLPFAMFGLAHIFRNLRHSAHRAILIALLISPAGAALVQTGITRTLTFVIPAAILTSIGFDQALHWIGDPTKRLAELSLGLGPTFRRVAASLSILLIGIPIAFISKDDTNRIVLSALVILLALQISGTLERLAQWLGRAGASTKQKFWNPSQTVLALSAFVVLSGANILMLNDALRSGPLWYRDYGMGGMQYGAFEIFDIIEQYVQDHPDTKIVFSPDWANGTDILARFFLGDPSPIQIGSIQGYIIKKFPVDEETLFIMTPREYEIAAQSDKLTDLRVETIIPYPDGNPGFYFVRLRYVDGIDEIFAAERAARQVLRESVVTVEGQEVKLRFSYLDAGVQAEAIALVFDNDPYTLAKTFENNPFVIEMTFPSPRTLSGFSIIIGSAKAQLTLKCYPTPGAQPVIYTFERQGTIEQPELSFDFPTPTQAQVLQVEMRDLLASEFSQIHIWELILR